MQNPWKTDALPAAGDGEPTGQVESLAEMRRRLIRGVTRFEETFRRRFPLLWLTTLVGPFLVTGVVLAGIGLGSGWAEANRYLMAGVVTFFVLGRFVILAGVDEGTEGWLAEYALAPGELFWMVTCMDLMCAMFVTFHMGILFRIPRVGPAIAGLSADARFIMDRQAWIRRLAFWVLVLFVIFPTSTTGSIGGSVFGRLLGLGRLRTIVAVILGSFLGNGIMLLFARQINALSHGPWGLALKLGGIAIIVVAMLAIEWRYRKARQKYLAEHMADEDNCASPGLGDSSCCNGEPYLEHAQTASHSGPAA